MNDKIRWLSKSEYKLVTALSNNLPVAAVLFLAVFPILDVTGVRHSGETFLGRFIDVNFPFKYDATTFRVTTFR